ncbi:MAG: GSCFA domain-containing protein [Tannerella sp.]|jgi:hypothetical protein|nr:GSCFA domain-containing protein [Tannerella sp.]
MRDFQTKVEIPVSECGIDYRHNILLMGSCFADHIGHKMSESGFNVCTNPFGVLYNPVSVAVACKRLLSGEPFSEGDLFYYNGVYSSFSHHGSFSKPAADEALEGMNDALIAAAEHLRKTDFLIITFGSAYIYYFKENAKAVANCHKRPEADFVRRRISANDIAKEWMDVIAGLLRLNPSLQVIFTVSPIRHFRDGAHQNQLSKATLLLAEQELTEIFPENVSYFPAYELMMDELRDYRFYADDMVHPSTLAVEYIWERFCGTYMDKDMHNQMSEVHSINKALNHRELNTNSKIYKTFLRQTLAKIERLKAKNPYICLSKTEKELLERIGKQ